MSRGVAWSVESSGGTHTNPLQLGRCTESLQLTMVRAMRFYMLVSIFLQTLQLTLRPFDEGRREPEGADFFLCEEFGREFGVSG